MEIIYYQFIQILNFFTIFQLVIALFGAVQAKPWFYGHYPVVYHAPTVYASNVCRNAAGAVVACAEGTGKPNF